MVNNDNEIQNYFENKPERRNDIDAIRVFAVILLIYFHTAMIFNIWSGFHIQNNELSVGMALFVFFIYMWHMPLFFFLAGMSTFYSLHFRTDKQYLKERFKRLFIPFLLGILIVVPPQVYFERLAWWCETRWSPINFNGSYIEFYPQFFTGSYPNGNFSWHHLWFLLYLFFISLVALPLFLCLKKEKGKQIVNHLGAYFERGRRIFQLVIPLIIINISLRGIFYDSYGFFNDWASILFFLTIFIFGFLIMFDTRFEHSIARNKRMALTLGVIIALFILLIYISINTSPNSSSGSSTSVGAFIGYSIFWGLFSLCSWCWLIAILGYGRTYLNKQSSLIDHLSEIALPFYILHETVIIIIGFYIVQMDANILVKYLVISTSALLITVLLCELVKTNNITRFIFGMRPRDKKI
ncbi:MAG: acyltransferase family protein [Promethearchaeota archaeon]